MINFSSTFYGSENEFSNHGNFLQFKNMTTEEICLFWGGEAGLFFSEGQKYHWLLRNLTVLSYLGNALVALIIYLNKDLIYIHPMKLFMSIAFLDSFLFWLLFMEPYICPLKMNELLAYSVF